MRHTKLTFLAFNIKIKFVENILFSDLLDNDRMSTMCSSLKIET